MKMRAPGIPLITVDPYFSVWSFTDELYASPTCLWTGQSNRMTGILEVDGTEFCFMSGADGIQNMQQISVDIDALTTRYVFAVEQVELTVTFSTPVVPYDLYLLTRPVSYMNVSCKSLDNREHICTVRVSVSSELCVDDGESVMTEEITVIEGVRSIKMGAQNQRILNKSGDDIKIDWGYFYLSVKGKNSDVGTLNGDPGSETLVCAVADVSSSTALFTFAFDDIDSIEYFGKHLRSYWNKNGETIETAIQKAYADYDVCMIKCQAFSKDLEARATESGGEQYAELLSLAYRQVIAAHKLVVDTNNELLYISKECKSNGCAATVDISYPSVPMFLIYNPALVQGMLRPVFQYVDSKKWTYDFAPHDVGQYPLLNGQVYGQRPNEGQMPVEECGNMIIMCAALAAATNDVTYAANHLEILEQWCRYLIQYGEDPENQLCTDDFAGHLAHNCNLSLKAIMGVASLASIYKMMNKTEKSSELMTVAKKMAKSWVVRAANGDGSFRLAFDAPGSFSMKYNVVWDRIFGFNLFDSAVIAGEIASYKNKFQKYGLPLDSRKTYTKSDWLVWVATLAETKEEFEEFIAPLWQSYNDSPSRVPMGDWFETVDATSLYFRHRSVQGGLFMKMLKDSGICKLIYK